MAHIIEEETGFYDGPAHQHDGYFAGDFWAASQPLADA